MNVKQILQVEDHRVDILAIVHQILGITNFPSNRDENLSNESWQITMIPHDSCWFTMICSIETMSSIMIISELEHIRISGLPCIAEARYWDL